ncbi:hypothetical protein JCM6882_005431 [Rhodosporidiobolus microsporus]
MQPASGKAKPGRKRIACIACSSNKQKCDGATRHPCRRCELYGLECAYIGGAVPKTAVRVDTTRPSTDASTSSTTGGSEKDDIAAAIREMTARLSAIEAGLEHDRRSGIRAATSSFAPPAPSTSSLAPLASTSSLTAGPSASTSNAAAHPFNVEMPADTNPLQVLVSTMEQMSRDEQAMEDGEDVDLDEGAGSESRSDQDSSSHLEQLAWKARNEPRSQKCDSFARGLVTLEDVEAAFGFYTQRIQPWIPVVEKRPPLVVREKSSFLFHIILLVTNYYNTSTAPRAKEVYAGLNSIVHELLVRHILAPDPSMFNRDFVRALLLLLYYKPVQSSYAERGLKSSSRVVHASKVNALSSLMIHALIRQAASFLNFHQAPHALAPFLDGGAPNAPSSTRDRAFADFRTWCTIITGDTLGSLQSGRMSWTDPTAALSVARRFAAAALDPTDVRRAAVVELYSIVTVPPSAANSTNPVRYRLEQLGSINAALDAWKEYWTPILAEAQNKGDPLAYTVTQTLAQFVILAVNGAVFTRWDLEKKKETDEGKEGRPTLTSEDWQHLQRAADAAADAIFVVSLEAATGHPLRECRWPEPVNGIRGALHLDPRVTEDFKTALDTMTCIAFVYSLLFLGRMASAGLITCDLVTRQADYAAGCDLSTPQALATGTKLPRLLELGAQFLTAISPNPDHPCCRHALLLEMILRVGLSATTPQGHASSPAASKGDKRSPAQSGGPHPPQRSATFPLPAQAQMAQPAAFPAAMALPPHLQSQPPQPQQQQQQQPPVAQRPPAPVNSFDSWLWDTSTPSAASFSGPLRMHDGSFVMPDLAGGGGNTNGAAAGSTPSPGMEQGQLGPRPSSRASNPATSSGADRNAALAMVASAGRGGNAAQAMASLLSEVNPFLDDIYSQQPALGLGSHAFNDDFGLGAAGVGAAGMGMGLEGIGLPGLEWASLPDPGAPAADGGAAPFGVPPAGGAAWPYGNGSS